MSANAGSIRAPFRPPRPVMGAAVPNAGSVQLDVAGLPHQQQDAPSEPARGLGQYSVTMPSDGIDPAANSQQLLHENAGHPSISVHDLQSPSQPQEPGHGQAELALHRQPVSQPCPELDTQDTPADWPLATGQLRAARAHMRARRRPHLEGSVQRESQEPQPAVEGLDGVPEEAVQEARQLQHPQHASAAIPPLIDLEGGTRQSAAADAADSQEPMRSVEPKTVQLQELNSSEQEQLGCAPSAPLDKSELERRRKSQEFIAHITEQARQMRAALHNSTSSSEQRQEVPDAAPEDMQADSPGMGAAFGQTQTDDDEHDIVVDLSSPSPGQPSPAATIPALSSRPPMFSQKPMDSSISVHSVEQRGSQQSQPESAALAMPHSRPGMLTDLPVADSTPTREAQDAGSQGLQHGTAAFAQACDNGAGLSSDMPVDGASPPHGGQHSAPQQSQPTSFASREAASPHSATVGVRLECRPELDVSPVRLSLNLDLTASSKQTLPQGSAQGADCDSASPADDAQVSASLQAVESVEPMHVEHPSPLTIQPRDATEALLLSNMPLSAIQPRGLFMSQPAQGAVGHPLAGLNPSPQHAGMQAQPTRVAAKCESNGRQDLPVASLRSGKMSQEAVDRHSDYSDVVQPSHQMHANPRSDSPRSDSHHRGSMELTSQPLDSSVSMERNAEGGDDKDMQGDQVQIHGPVRSSGSKLHAFRHCSRPPTRAELQGSMAERGIPGILYQGVYYGNPSDVPERPIGRHSRHSLVQRRACTLICE